MLAFNSFKADFENGCSVIGVNSVAAYKIFMTLRLSFKNASWKSASGVSKITKTSLPYRESSLMGIDLIITVLDDDV